MSVYDVRAAAVFAALVVVLALVVAPIVGHLAWDVFVAFWNVV